jgi:hypothetical protein
MAAVSSSCAQDYFSLIRLKQSTESLVDLTYFKQWLPLPVLTHRLMQGYTMRK